MTAQPVHEPLGELEAKVEAVRADVKQQVAGGRDRGVSRAGEARKRVQAGGARLAEEAVPEHRADPDDARQLALGDAEADRALEAADVGEHVA